MHVTRRYTFKRNFDGTDIERRESFLSISKAIEFIQGGYKDKEAEEDVIHMNEAFDDLVDAKDMAFAQGKKASQLKVEYSKTAEYIEKLEG
jgi:hypothetical protein